MATVVTLNPKTHSLEHMDSAEMFFPLSAVPNLSVARKLCKMGKTYMKYRQIDPFCGRLGFEAFRASLYSYVLLRKYDFDGAFNLGSDNLHRIMTYEELPLLIDKVRLSNQENVPDFVKKCNESFYRIYSSFIKEAFDRFICYGHEIARYLWLKGPDSWAGIPEHVLLKCECTSRCLALITKTDIDERLKIFMSRQNDLTRGFVVE